jgi:hypothetical protein
VAADSHAYNGTAHLPQNTVVVLPKPLPLNRSVLWTLFWAVRLADGSRNPDRRFPASPYRGWRGAPALSRQSSFDPGIEYAKALFATSNIHTFGWRCVMMSSVLGVSDQPVGKSGGAQRPLFAPQPCGEDGVRDGT